MENCPLLRTTALVYHQIDQTCENNEALRLTEFRCSHEDPVAMSHNFFCK